MSGTDGSPSSPPPSQAPTRVRASGEYGHPRTTLLAIEDPRTRALYAECLREHWDLHEVGDGRDALARALGMVFDVIVADVRLPGIHGYQLCDVIRRDRFASSTQFIAIAGENEPADMARARRAGADRLLVKPLSPETLLSEMEGLVSANGLAPMDRHVADRRVVATETDTRGPKPFRRSPMSRTHVRERTSVPPATPPSLICPACTQLLTYRHSQIGGVNARHAEQWDYYECPGACGPFQYRQRTRKLRKL